MPHRRSPNTNIEPIPQSPGHIPDLIDRAGTFVLDAGSLLFEEIPNEFRTREIHSAKDVFQGVKQAVRVVRQARHARQQ